MIETLWLALGYGAAVTLFGVVALCAGWSLWPPRPAERFTAQASALVAQYVLGLALFAWLAAWAGLAGQMRLAVVAPLWLVVAGVGAGRAWRAFSSAATPLRAVIPIDFRWQRPEGLALLFLLAAALLLSLHIAIGGLSPDLGHDPMWYHLAVPGQWAITGRLDAFPLVFPSNYPLAQEALLAPLLLAGDDILCVAFCAQTALALLWAPVFLACARYGRGGALWALAFFPPTLAALFALAPVTVKNDRFAVLLFVAAMAVLEPIYRSRPSSNADHDDPPLQSALFVAFFLVGSTVAAKLIAIVFAGALTVVFAMQVFGGASPFRRRWGAMGIAIGALALAYAPWMIRGLCYSGNPFYPLASGLFPVRAEYQAGLETMTRLHDLYPLTLQGFGEALLEGVPAKIRHIMLSRDVLFAIALVAAVGGLLARTPWLVLQGGAFLIGAVVFLAVRGHSETARFFSTGYGLALGPVAWMLSRLDNALQGRRLRLVALVAVWSGCAWTYGARQHTFARSETIRWAYRPRVTEEQVWTFAGHAEKGEAFAGGRAVRAATPAGARIVLADGHYPFHMERECLWSDEALGPLADTFWQGWAADDILDYLHQQGVDHVVAVREAVDDRLMTLERTERLRPISLGAQAPPTWRLWRVQAVDSDRP